MTAMAQQEAAGDYEMRESDMEENDPETPAKNGRLGTTRGETPNHGFLAL